MTNKITDSYIRDNIKKIYDPVQMSGGYYFLHTDTLNKINLYYNSKFLSGDRDSLGFKKYFFNITKPACDVATKFIDLDTKDILLISENPGQEMVIFLMQKELKRWLKETGFAGLLNEIATLYPKMGHVVIKKAKDRWENVNIMNLRVDPSAQSLDSSGFIYEVHRMSPVEIRSMGWNQKTIDQFLGVKQKDYVVYECYDKQDNGWTRTIRGGLFLRRSAGGTIETPESIISSNTDLVPSYLLWKDRVASLPYRELKWEDVPGRWLGFGFSEYLFDNQVRENELANLKAKGLWLSSLNIFQSRDDTIGRNLLTDVENGDIIKTALGVERIDTQEKNLHAFDQEEARWDMNSERKTFTFDISRGEQLPSRTPLGVANLSAGMVASYFDVKRENFGIFIRNLILDDIIPSFKRVISREHIVPIASSDADSDMFDKLVSGMAVDTAKAQYAEKTGFAPDPARMESQKDMIAKSISKKTRFIKVPPDFYKNAKAIVDVIITGEQMDVGAKIQTIQIALQLVGSNPAILADKATRTIFFKLLELAGISPYDLNLMQQQPQMQVPQGGSVSAPQQGAPQQVATRAAV